MRTLVERLNQQQKPATASLLGRAYLAEMLGDSLVISLDEGCQNLIPMLESHHHLDSIARAARDLSGRKLSIEYRIGKDPTLETAREAEQNAVSFVQNDDRVRYALDLFKGTIVKCEPLGDKERD